MPKTKVQCDNECGVAAWPCAKAEKKAAWPYTAPRPGTCKARDDDLMLHGKRTGTRIAHVKHVLTHAKP